MRKMVIICVLATFALGGSAFAEDPNDMDLNNIGIYLNPAGTGSCGAIDADIPFTVFVVLTRLTNPEVWGWEAKFVYENILGLGVSPYGDHIDAGTREGEHIVGLAEPLMAMGGTAVVAEMHLMVNGALNDITQASNVYVQGTFFPLLPNGQPAYLEASGSDGVALWQAINGPETPQLSMNCDCAPVAVEASSWGNVKSLYR
jgi:hypothetical protein